jgi:hypothetical protein
VYEDKSKLSSCNGYLHRQENRQKHNYPFGRRVGSVKVAKLKVRVSKSKKRKVITSLLVDFLQTHNSMNCALGMTQEYIEWLREQDKKQTGLCSLFDFYAEKIMKVLEE